MGLSNQSSGGAKLIYLNFKAGRPNTDEQARFARKVDGVEESFTTVKGNLLSVEYVETQREGDVKQNFALTMEDNGEKYKITFPFSSVSISVLNSLCSKERYGSIEISAYKKDGRARLSVRNDGEIMSWNWDLDAIKSMQTKVKVNGKEVTDNTELYAYVIESMIPAADAAAKNDAFLILKFNYN